MATVQRMRETVSALPTSDEIGRREREGWRLVAIEWERQAEAGRTEWPKADVPYGLRISDDCAHLEADPAEREALTLMLELIGLDQTLTEIAAELNRRGFRTRGGLPWSQVAVFNLLPRLIDAAPEIWRAPAPVVR